MPQTSLGCLDVWCKMARRLRDIEMYRIRCSTEKLGMFVVFKLQMKIQCCNPIQLRGIDMPIFTLIERSNDLSTF